MLRVMFCSDLTADAGEPLLGSASRGDRFVLVAQPKAAWAPKALKTPERAPLAAWASAFDARYGGKTVIRLFAPSDETEGVELRVFPQALRLRVPALEAVPAALEALFGAPTPPPEAQSCPRTVAVCTHGKHDRCCAKHGQALFTRLRELARDVDFEVVESSHLGGHRFAGTCLDLAPGHPARMYGRLQQEEAEPLFRHLVENRIWLARYRGRCDLESGGQIAEAQALALGARGTITVTSDEAHRRRATWADGETTAELSEKTFTSKAACGDDSTTRTRLVLQSAR